MSGYTTSPSLNTVEGKRLRTPGWQRWGTYISERQWGTVREDYSPDGDAWAYFPYDHARSRAYRWGEDGIGGFCDDQQRWCLALALWNENDPTLKERLFGLTNTQGNHGEDVKEHYVYADATPTHSYCRMLYRYPHAAFPYENLLTENARRNRTQPEYEIYDTGVFDNDAYFDVIIEYAKADTDDILMRMTAHNRGAAAAPLHLIPHLWSRNTWSWSALPRTARIRATPDGALLATRATMADRRLDIDANAKTLFCENETNVKRLYNQDKPGPFKDAINDAIVHNDPTGLGQNEGSKAAFCHRVVIAPGASTSLRLRFRPADSAGPPFADFDAIFAERLREADAFYAAVADANASAETRMIQRRAFAGMLWTKQYYHLDIPRWLDGDPAEPPPPDTRTRNAHWRHLNNADIITMPDKWEYPWYAAWDLGFHTVVLARIDPEYAKNQLLLLTREWYMHPNGQLPAYEWSFGDVNPPVHAYAAWRVYQTDTKLTGHKDKEFLKRIFNKMLLNFTWWVNQKDRDGRNVFQGGFLGLDNVEIFDRSKPLPTGGSIDQADGTAWMAMYSLNMMRMSIELAYEDAAYEDMASKFFEHFLAIAGAMTDMGGKGTGLWDEDDGFFYDVLALPDGRNIRLQLRSIVGLIPMFAVEVLDSDVFERLPDFAIRTQWFLKHRPGLASLVSRWTEPGKGDLRLLSLLRGHRLTCLLRRMLDQAEFLSPYGVRSLSKIYAKPYELDIDGQHFEIGYEPGEATGFLYGGNSNWRGPVWFPINVMLIDALRSFHTYYGDDFRVECPVGSGTKLSLKEVADFLAARLVNLFRIGPDGKRPFCGNRPGECGASDELMFNEYFHGETGQGLGAAHQTGWTGLVACLLGEAN
jgi:hypothetical protein